MLKKLRTLIRTTEAQITGKIRTSSLGEKKGVLIKKNGVAINYYVIIIHVLVLHVILAL